MDLARVYLYAVRRKMTKDIRAARTFTSLTDKVYFLCELSWEMILNEQMTMNYRAFPDRLREYFGEAVSEERDLDHWHYDMLGQTMLIRNNAGDYAPAHRSLLEFLVAFKLVAELGFLQGDYLGLLQEDAEEGATPVTMPWREYFSKVVGQGRPPVRVDAFERPEIHALASTVGAKPVSGGSLR